MRFNSLSRMVAALTLCLVSATADLSAQAYDSGSQVQGMGVATVERMPEFLRMHVQLTAKGKSVKEALATLKDRQEAVKAVLPTLGADAGSIKFENLDVTRGEEQQKINQMLMERMGRTKRGGPSTGAVPSTATIFLTADWKLSATDQEALLNEAYGLIDKIKAADVGGTKDAEKLSAEEEELQAELQQMSGRGNQEAPGEPHFAYVAKISEADRTKAAADAFEKAKSDAERLAAAAGAKLGKLMALSSQGRESSGPDYSDYGSNPYLYEMRQRQMQAMAIMGAGKSEEADKEAIGYKPEKVRYSVLLQARFALD